MRDVTVTFARLLHSSTGGNKVASISDCSILNRRRQLTIFYLQQHLWRQSPLGHCSTWILNKSEGMKIRLADHSKVSSFPFLLSSHDVEAEPRLSFALMIIKAKVPTWTLINILQKKERKRNRQMYTGIEIWRIGKAFAQMTKRRGSGAVMKEVRSVSFSLPTAMAIG